MEVDCFSCYLGEEIGRMERKVEGSKGGQLKKLLTKRNLIDKVQKRMDRKCPR